MFGKKLFGICIGCVNFSGSKSKSREIEIENSTIQKDFYDVYKIDDSTGSNNNINEIKDNHFSISKNTSFVNQVSNLNELNSGDDEYTSVEEALEKLGGFSWFQILASIIILSPEITAAMIALSPILTSSSKVPFECHRNNGSSYEYGILENINICSNINCSGTLKGTLKDYGTSRSIVQEWELICDRSWISDTITSVQMTGSMIGALVGSYIADRIGRKKTFFGLCFLMGIFGSLSGFAQTPLIYSFTRFFSGLAIGGCFVVYLNYLMEFLTPSYRTICGCISLWSLGEMLLAVLGYFLQSWRALSKATSLPILFFICLAYPLIPESPRWLLCKKRTRECTSAFDQIARWNGKPSLKEIDIVKLQNRIHSQRIEQDQKVNILSIFRSPDLRKQLLLLCLHWFSASVVFYGISFNMKNLSGNPHLNIFYLGLVDLSSFSTIYFNNRFGRRKTFLAFLILGSIFLVTLFIIEMTYLKDDFPNLITILCLCGRFCNSASWGVMALLTAERFPTFGRATCMGICAFSGNLGGILAPQLAYLAGTVSKSVPTMIYCILNILSSFSALLLNDTIGPLQDSLN